MAPGTPIVNQVAIPPQEQRIGIGLLPARGSDEM